jgi:pilus assembly protein CpaB
MLALILATLATVGVFLYTRGVKQNAETGGTLTTVVVSKVDIPANTDLGVLVSQDQFTTADVPTDTVVDGAITQVSQLKGRRSNTFILAGEQIPISRVMGNKVPGGVLSIPEGYQALTVLLDGAPAVGGTLAGGDHVSIFATFEGVKVAQKNQSTTTVGAAQGEAATVVLVPDVQVLRVITQSDNSAGTGTGVIQAVTVTLALTPEDAQKFVFALEQGKVYFSLLPPDGQGTELPPLTVQSVLNPPKPKKS